MKEVVALHSLHRPYHCPLWIVKWVCCYYAQRRNHTRSRFRYEDTIVDLYFVLLEWLKKSYPKNNAGLPSYEAISAVYEFFWSESSSIRPKLLKEILGNSNREKGIQTQVYSTYKAVAYYHNLAKEKLHFVNADGTINEWTNDSLISWRKSSIISKEDRKIYITRILKYDTHFFLSQYLLRRHIKKYELDPESATFDFIQQYYPLPRFEYNSRSHHNYYYVRKQWMNLLRISSARGITPMMKSIVLNDSNLSRIYENISSNINNYTILLKSNKQFNRQVNLFYECYKSKARNLEKANEYVNLYDICSAMNMSYTRFNTFLSKFYETERTKKNIFFINIVSTIDQRKRFYIRETPVLKIKIL